MGYKILRGKFTLPLLVLVVLFITGCCSCGSGEENVVKGVITVVGNDPFARLAVKLDNNKAYLLECSEKLKKELWNQQGNSYAIHFSESRMENGIPVLVVDKAISLVPKSKN